MLMQVVHHEKSSATTFGTTHQPPPLVPFPLTCTFRLRCGFHVHRATIRYCSWRSSEEVINMDDRLVARPQDGQA
ncbi:hypothetical protein Syun_029833 [Stephania yunnanensis]|uniref:Uncharacterized protein n=1 Tax=Stephania yunnanensis TaxID=152371 RepID=A0AAP0E6B3_9MAGN